MQIVELLPVRPEDVQLAQVLEVREFQLAEIAKVFALPTRAIAPHARALDRAKVL